MKKIISISLLSIGSLLAGCSSVDLDAPRSSSSGSSFSLFEYSEFRCDADPAQKMVGQKYSDSIAEQARKASGSRTVRTLRPRQVITLEYDPERLTLRLDGNDVIEAIGCG